MSETCKHEHSEHEHHELRVEGLCVSYGNVDALCQVDFTITCGHRLALLGPNGAGKSTLLRVLAGLVKPNQGSVVWRGSALKASTREIAFLPQRDNREANFPITVKEVVEMGRYPHLGMWRRFGKVDEEKVEEACTQMKLLDLLDRQIDQLSGGQQQRTFIARALAQEAHVLMLDEPFNGLDVESREDLTKVLIELSQHGHLIITSHHNPETVTSIYDHALVLKKSVVAFGESNEVMGKESVREALKF